MGYHRAATMGIIISMKDNVCFRRIRFRYSLQTMIDPIDPNKKAKGDLPLAFQSIHRCLRFSLLNLALMKLRRCAQIQSGSGQTVRAQSSACWGHISRKMPHT